MHFCSRPIFMKNYTWGFRSRWFRIHYQISKIQYAEVYIPFDYYKIIYQ